MSSGDRLADRGPNGVFLNSAVETRSFGPFGVMPESATPAKVTTASGELPKRPKRSLIEKLGLVVRLGPWSNFQNRSKSSWSLKVTGGQNR